MTDTEAVFNDVVVTVNKEASVKLLSEKMPNGILKFENIHREKAAEQEFDGSSAEELFDEFNQMISKNQVETVQ